MEKEKVPPKKTERPEDTPADTHTPSVLGRAVEHHRAVDKKTKDLEQASAATSTTMKAIATSTESGKQYEVPLRAAITVSDKNLDIQHTSIWTLMTLNQMTAKQIADFEKAYGEDLTMSEKLSIKLLKDAMRGDKKATEVYWNIQDKVLARPKVLNQINITTGVEGSIMSQMLDQITANLTQNKNTEEEVAQEGEIIE